jgi:hypothetical protein
VGSSGPAKRRRDFFVSYTQSDRDWAEWIAWQLEAEGYSVLLEAWDLVPGTGLVHIMDQATRFAERTIAVLSNAYLESSNVGAAEWLAAFRRDPLGLESRLIPVRVEDCTVDGLLAGIVYADLFGLADKDSVRERLVTVVATALNGRAKPLVEPPLPTGGQRASQVSRPDRTSEVVEIDDVPVSEIRSHYLSQVHQIAAAGEQPRAHSVFICHSSGDKERVRALYRQLQLDGVSCWFDEEDLLPGQDWAYEIGRAIQASRFVLACLSRDSITRAGYIQKELRKALDVADEQPEASTFLIPARLEQCEIPERLRRWQWVDLFNNTGYDRLLRVLKAAQNSGS